MTEDALQKREPQKIEIQSINGTELLMLPIDHQLAHVPQLIEKVSKVLKIAPFGSPFYSQTDARLGDDSQDCVAASLLNALYAAGVDEAPTHARKPDDLAPRLTALWKEYCRAHNRPENAPLAQADAALQMQGIFHETDILLQYFKERTGNWYDWKRVRSPLEIAYTLC